MSAARTLVAALMGAAVAVLAWLALVPWDLSEISTNGRAIDGGGGDANAWPIALVGAAVVVVGSIAISRRETRAHAPALIAGGLACWAALFAWRAGVSETSGANPFFVPLVVVFIPAAVIAPFVFRALAARLDRA